MRIVMSFYEVIPLTIEYIYETFILPTTLFSLLSFPYLSTPSILLQDHSHIFLLCLMTFKLTNAVYLTMSLPLSLETYNLNSVFTTKGNYCPSQESLSSHWFGRDRLFSRPVMCRPSLSSQRCCEFSSGKTV